MKKKRLLNFLVSLLLILSIVVVPCVSFADEEMEEELTEEELAWDNADDAIYGGLEEDEEDPSLSYVESSDSSTIIDIKDTYLRNRVDFLVKLGFMSTYEDKTFKPDEKITRAEFLKSVFKAINYDLNSYYKTDYKFNDINTDNENYALMAAALERGYIGLYNDGTIRPDGEISTVDCATILLKIMGYSTYAGMNPGYPTGYVSTAHKLGFFKNVEQSTQGATRAEAAQLIFTALNTEMLREIQSGDFHKYYTDKRVTLLSAYHDIYYETGIVTATGITAIGNSVKQKVDNVLINDIMYKLHDKSYNDYIGYDVNYWYVMKEDSPISEIIYMLPNSNLTELVIQADDIIGYSRGILQYYENNRRKSVKIALDCDLIYNGKLKESYDNDVYKIENGYIKLVAVDGTDYNLVFVNSYYNISFKSISAKNSLVSILGKYGEKPIVIDVSKSYPVVDMYNSNGRMDVTISQQKYYDDDSKLQTKTILPSIPANSVLSIFADKMVKKNGKLQVADDAEYIKIIISENKIEGSVDSMQGDTVTISGKEVYVSSSNYLYDTNPKFSLGAVGTFVLDYSGKLAIWIPDTKALDYKYGYLINAVREGGLSSRILIKILTDANEIVVFKSAGNLKINDKLPRNVGDALGKLRESAKMIDSTFNISQLVKYTVNSNNEVTKLQTVTASTGIAEGYDEDHLNRAVERGTYNCRSSYGYALVINKTTPFAGPSDVYFYVPVTETFDDEDYSAGSAWDEQNKVIDIYDVSDTLKPNAIVAYGAAEDPVFSEPFLIVSDISEKLIEDDQVVIELTGYSGSAQRTYEMDYNLKDSVKVGDIIGVTGKQEKHITKVDYITSISEVLNDNVNAEPSTITEFKGKSTTKYAFKVFEAYDYDVDTRALILQKGSLVDGTNKRTFQRISYWFPKAASFKFGATLCEVTENGEFTLASGAYSHVKGAVDYGAASASKILLCEQAYGVRFMVIVNKLY